MSFPSSGCLKCGVNASEGYPPFETWGRASTLVSSSFWQPQKSLGQFHYCSDHSQPLWLIVISLLCLCVSTIELRAEHTLVRTHSTLASSLTLCPNTHSDTLEVKPSTQLNPHLIVTYLFVCVYVDMLVHM